jgi:hypothetical protein
MNELKSCFIGKLKVKKNLPKEVFIFKRGKLDYAPSSPSIFSFNAANAPKSPRVDFST